MKKQKKILVQIIVFLTILLSSCQVFATDITKYLGELQFSENYLKYLELSDEQKENVIAPRMYDIPKSKITVTNPLRLTNMLRSSLASTYSLRTIIPENMVVKNQQQTGTCYAFSSLAALESTLALKDYKNGKSPIVYDFSERHMEYATSRTFLNGVINEKGHAREVGEGGVRGVPIAYLTNGTGAIAEADMPFENNEDKIDISAIQNKEVVTQVNDTIDFSSYSVTEDTTQIKLQMKEHIMNYGAIDAGIHGADPLVGECYNNTTGALYCSAIGNEHPINHAVIIVGWDDSYSKENFAEANRPSTNGAWIIRNSWGTEIARYTLSEMKEAIIEELPEIAEQQGWSEATQIPDDAAKSIFQQLGFTIENDVAIMKIGKDGFMYISYEDVNIYQDLTGIIDAQSELTYENIYQYDYYGSFLSYPFATSKIYLATVFNKKTTGEEYLTQVGINAAETYTCKVYVNPNGTSKAMSDLQQVQLKAGSKETFDAGYHTIEFLEPVKINSDSFVVVLEIEGTEENSIATMMEFDFGGYFTGEDYANVVYHVYDNVTVENGKCFWSVEEVVNSNEWVDTSTMYSLTEGRCPNFDTTIKAFTTSKILESIEVTTPPTKTSYMQGEDFDATGMVVKAKYTNGISEVITDYKIADGTNLTLGQTSVTISYKGKTTTQAIEVVENSVESIAIKADPTKTEYFAGEDFDATGMVIEAIYTDGTAEEITDYTVQDGVNLKNGQTTVTIAYEGKTVTQAITVQANPVEKIEIIQAPNKVNYVVGQNFDRTGMIVEATYENEMVKQVEDYTIQDGENLQLEQTEVTIVYEDQTTTQAITVEEKTVTSISIKTMPTKTEYIQNKDELDLTGGVIEISYNDESTEEMSMISEQITVSGFNNQELGTITITLTYQEKTTQFNVEIKEEPKPENSNFDNMKGNVTRIRVYTFSDDNEEEYTVINVELSNITKATVNDEMEYYYYLSSNPNETDITDWVKMNIVQDESNKIQFEINTKDISNYQDLLNANKIYLYVKEVAIRNNARQEKITLSFELSIENLNVEEYIDGEKVAEVTPDQIINSTPGDKNDSTTATGTIPNAGKSILIICLIFAIFIIARLSYLRYKDIQIK